VSTDKSSPTTPEIDDADLYPTCEAKAIDRLRARAREGMIEWRERQIESNRAVQGQRREYERGFLEIDKGCGVLLASIIPT
jgi:hypothetical protein